MADRVTCTPIVVTTPLPRCAWETNACWRYRVEGRVAYASMRGVPVQLAPLSEVSSAARTVVVLRPTDPDLVGFLRSRCPSAKIIADWDDLLFGDASSMPAVMTGWRTLEEQEHRCRRAREAAASVDAHIVSTHVLARFLGEFLPGSEVHVARNEPDPVWVSLARGARRWAPGDLKVVRWFIGSKARELDADIVADPLRSLMLRDRTVCVEIYGALRWWRTRLPYWRIRMKKTVPWRMMAGVQAESWLTIAPLADLPFNECKSAIKVQESAAAGVPCLATPIPSMTDDAAGMAHYAANRGDWDAGFAMVEDTEGRRDMYERGFRGLERMMGESVGHEAWFRAVRGI